MSEGVFPPPVYDMRTRRPHYTAEMQTVCLAVRERNVGVNGRVVLFYARRPPSVTQAKSKTQGSASSRKPHRHAGLIEGLEGAGPGDRYRERRGVGVTKIVSLRHRRGGGGGSAAECVRSPDATALGGKTREKIVNYSPSGPAPPSKSATISVRFGGSNGEKFGGKVFRWYPGRRRRRPPVWRRT